MNQPDGAGDETSSDQYGIGQGPCISAAAEGRTMRSGSLGGDPRWPRFGPRAGRLGVHSVLSVPLRTPGGVLGAMNVYAHAHDAFDDHAEEVGEMFAVPAAISVLNAQILAQSQRLATQLEAALQSRPIIDQAIGILRSRNGDTAQEAFDTLRKLSQHGHMKLLEVARNIVEEAAAKACARRSRTRSPARDRELHRTPRGGSNSGQPIRDQSTPIRPVRNREMEENVHRNRILGNSVP